MSDLDLDLGDDSRIENEAAEWLVKRDLGFTAEEQDAFFHWLGQNPLHGDQFARLQKTWTEFDHLAQWMPEHSGEPNPDLLANGMPRRWWKPFLAVAASLVIAFTLWSLYENADGLPETQAQHIIAGDYGYHILDDGSELDMNHGAEVSVEFSEGARLVKLLAGEVHFTVAKNPNRPFIVRAGGTDVRAVGTAFNVILGSDTLEVLVTEGKVRVEKAKLAGKRNGNTNTSETGLDLTPGQRSVLPFDSDGSGFAAMQIENGEIGQLLSWKHETLEFDSTPLGEAILEFNRRNDLQLAIEDNALGELPVVASFRSNNPEGFVSLLEIAFDVEVNRVSDLEIVLKKR
jgi:transmembrane sensor